MKIINEYDTAKLILWYQSGDVEIAQALHFTLVSELKSRGNL